MKATWRTVVVTCVLSSLTGCGPSPTPKQDAAARKQVEATDTPPILAALLMDADEKQFAEIFPKFEKQAEQGLPILISEVNLKLLLPDATNEAKEKLAKRQANAAVALLKLDQPAKVWSLLKHSPDPTLRSFVIKRMGPFGVDPKVLIAQLEEQKEVSVKRAILLSLGGYGPDRFSLAERKNQLPRLLQLYRDDPDPGIHSATEWLLRQWQASDEVKEINKELATGKVEGKRQWYVNGQGQTMVVIPGPVEFVMGSPTTEVRRQDTEIQHQSRIDRNFAIASKEVTVEQFLRFNKEHQYANGQSPTDDCPINRVTWFDAVAYCNWLNEQEGIPKDQWCYEPNKAVKYADGMTLATDYLKRTGYRLPTEAEWEYACRAGADTAYSFGRTEELLGKYGWYEYAEPLGKYVVGNSLKRSHPVGSLRANDLGLFDMHGNVWEWCQDAFAFGVDDKAKMDQEEKNRLVTDGTNRMLRGSSYTGFAANLRSAARFPIQPQNANLDAGFRVARTLPHVPFTPLPSTR